MKKDFNDWLIDREDSIEYETEVKLEDKLKEISKRFDNGTETIEDIMHYCRNYNIKFEIEGQETELVLVEKKYLDKLVQYIENECIPKQKVKDKIEELRDSYELHQRSWANRCLDIIEDYVKNSVYKNKILEEDKAIEKLKKYIENDDFYNIYKEIKEDKRQGKIGGTYIDFCNAIETVLSMLKEKDKEIEKKDKIIDLMADYIATLDIEEDICANVENDNCDKMNFGECEDCIKQYFKRKVEE